jgi:polyhydroxyalkanoate synthesis regulator protein
MNLTPQQTQILQTLNNHGGYASLEVTLDAALLALAEQITRQAPLNNPEYQSWLEETRRKLEVGRQAADQGELLDVADVIEQLNAKIAAARSAQS